MKAFVCALVILFMSATVLLVLNFNYDDGGVTKDSVAKWQMITLEEALKKRFLESDGFLWSEQLEDIADLLHNGKAGLIDPWGNEYKFAIVERVYIDGTLYQDTLIWTEVKKSGRTRVIAWPSGMDLTEELKEDGRREAKAQDDVKVLEQGCMVYHFKNGKWPATLDELADTIERGDKVLIDPWGSKYKFTLGRTEEADKSQIERPYIWSERTLNGFPRICGNRPPVNKKTKDDPQLAEPK